MHLIIMLLLGIRMILCLEDSFDREYMISKNKFTVISVNLSHSEFSDEAVSRRKNDSGQELERYSFIVQPTNEADLPSNWNYLVSSNADAVILYGVALERSSLDLFIIRYDLELNINSKVLRVRLTSTDELSREYANTNPFPDDQDSVSSMCLHLELGFHKINLEEFLISKSKLLDSMMSRILWAESRLVEVSIAPNGSVKVAFERSDSGVGKDEFIAQLEAEVWRSTRYANPQLCKFKESKTISVEHYFRSLDLYPNWCMLKVTRFQVQS